MKKASAFRERFSHAGSRGRTDTRFKSNGILSPARLPIPPCRQNSNPCRSFPIPCSKTGICLKRSKQKSVSDALN